MYQEAYVCGRFQPPHNDHVEYILRAKEKCKFLWIGIVKPNIRVTLLCREAHHRSLALSNPLTFFERIEIINNILLSKGISRYEFSCTPFPLDEPDILPDFMPTNIPCLTTICEDWNRSKIDTLKNCGYTVEVLFERKKKNIEGSRIRDAILRGSLAWESDVPEETRVAITALDLRSRLLTLSHNP